MAPSHGLIFFLFFLCFLPIFLISGLQQSEASPSVPSIKKLARAGHTDNANHFEEVSPSPSPSLLPDLNKLKERDNATLLFVVPPAPSPSNSNLAPAVDPCHGKSAKNFTSCLQHARNEKEPKSGGEIPVKVNVTFVPSNVTSNETWSAAQSMKDNVTDGIRGNSFITVNVGVKESILDQKPELDWLLNPGQRILICLVIVAGVGAWGFYLSRFRRSKRGAMGWVGIPYKRVDASDIKTWKGGRICGR